MINKIKKTYSYDDVLIKPLPSSITSRDAVDISVKLSNFLTINFPLIASPMVGVTSGKFAKQLSDLGGIAILHRFYETRGHLFDDINNNLTDKDNYGVSVKVEEENFQEYFEKSSPKIICVDTANGYNYNLIRYVYKLATHIQKNNYNCLILAGNVVTEEGCTNLYNNGCELIRVNIGSGSPCSTRNITGIGIPEISAISDCHNPGKRYKIVADGGIKNSGDFCKAVVAGANAGMSGKLFAETFEAPNEGILRGMASRGHQESLNIVVKSVEGFDTLVDKKHSLADFIKEFGYGIKSCGTYLNASNLNEICKNGEFVSVSNTAIKKL